MVRHVGPFQAPREVNNEETGFSQADVTRLLALLFLQTKAVTPQVLARELIPNPLQSTSTSGGEKAHSSDSFLPQGKAAG